MTKTEKKKYLNCETTENYEKTAKYLVYGAIVYKRVRHTILQYNGHKYELLHAEWKTMSPVISALYEIWLEKGKKIINVWKGELFNRAREKSNVGKESFNKAILMLSFRFIKVFTNYRKTYILRIYRLTPCGQHLMEFIHREKKIKNGYDETDIDFEENKQIQNISGDTDIGSEEKGSF